MQVILIKNVENLGNTGALVNVKNGYARNYLLPRGFAILANSSNKASLDHQIKIVNARKDEEIKSAKALATKIEKVSVTIAKQVGEEEKIFGSVTTAEIEDALRANEGLNVSKKDIVILEEIKKIGVYSAQIKLHPDVVAKFKIWVVAAT